MINFDFLPSRQVALYMARLFVTRSLVVLVALVLVLMTLDLLGQSSKIVAVAGNSDADVWHYVALRLPTLVSFVLPFSMLLGSLIAFTSLNQHSEVVAMKAAGLSAHQILAPMIVASLGIAVLTFAFNETVVVKAERELSAWTDADFHKVPPDSGLVANVWLLDGDDLVHVDTIGGAGAGLILHGVTIYQRDKGALVRTIEAREARRDPTGNRWVLSDGKSFDADQGAVQRFASMTALPGVAPERFTLAKVVPDERDFVSLHQAIGELEAAGRPTDEALTGWWHKLSGPLSAVLMPLLAAMAAFGLARSGQVLLRATVGMALGFTYFVVDSIGVALGNAGAYPPLLAAWAPFFLFLLIGEAVLIRGEE